MRKRTLNHFFDTVFWYLIYSIPIIVYFYYLHYYSADIVSFPVFCNNVNLSILTDNIVYSSLYGIFGVGGILPLFNSEMPFIICSWFICVFLLHLAVDFLLFLARLCHKWLNAFEKGD